MPNSRAQHDAFTLVELSIVLVILGLLVGGVLAGQSLIHAAELRSVTNEYTSYKTALGAFREKYNAVPGDMPNAIRFWGKADGADADGLDTTCQALDETHVAVGTETCNGDGNGLVAYGSSSMFFEIYRGWQHLANAGMIEGSYTGITAGAYAGTSVIGLNTPKSKYPSAGWTLFSADWLDDASWGLGGNYRNTLILGATMQDDLALTSVLKAEDMYSIDAKIDDGKPQNGILRSGNHAGMPDCVVATDDAYDLANATLGCVALFITGY